MHTAGEKKAIAIILTVAVVFTAVVGGTVAALVVGKHDPESAYLHLAVGNQLTTIEPTTWCDVYQKNCVSNPAAHHVAVPIGETVTLAVSQEIASAPWGLVTQYARADGTLIDTDPAPAFQRSGETYTVLLPSTPDRVLVAIEVQALSVVASGDTVNLRGLLSVDTTPTGFTLVAPPAT